jgi:flagellin
MSISLSSGVRNALSAIQSNSSQAEVQQKRLATGKKVNSAIDNPANFFTSQGLKSRSADLGRLLDGIAQGAKTLEAADKGIKSLTKLVEAAQGAARQALQNASTSPKVTTAGATPVTGTTTLTSVAGGGFAATDTISVNGTAVQTVAAGTTVQDLANSINSNATLNPPAGPAKVRATVANGALQVESLDGSAVAVTSSNSAALGSLFGTGATTAAANNNTVRENLSKQFDDLRTQIDQLSKDTGYNGINLLNGDSLKVQFNEKDTSSITITGVKFDSAGLGVRASANKFQSDTDINRALGELTTAVEKLRTQASTFGSNLSVVQNRQEFTKDFIDTLETGADQLVLADQNEEAAKLLTLNTRQQLSQTALSLASQADQGVLRLF